MTDPHALLAEYVTKGSEPAFREVVARYINLVYATAVRLVDGDTHRAQDVTQMVFSDLARLAGRCPQGDARWLAAPAHLPRRRECDAQ